MPGQFPWLPPCPYVPRSETDHRPKYRYLQRQPLYRLMLRRPKKGIINYDNPCYHCAEQRALRDGTAWPPAVWPPGSQPKDEDTSANDSTSPAAPATTNVYFCNPGSESNQIYGQTINPLVSVPVAEDVMVRNRYRTDRGMLPPEYGYHTERRVRYVTMPVRSPTSPPTEQSKRLPQLDGGGDFAPITTRYCCPDRFMRATPTKETFILGRFGDDGSDPFAPVASRSVRRVEKFATVRSVSTPTVWSVGGSAVTEGVASTVTGRGRRTTSGTSAPHHAADFLGSRSPAEETSTHRHRLAIAMDLCQTSPMSSTPSSPASPVTPSNEAPWQHAKWTNDRWERPFDTSPPSKPKAQASRKISTVPYKVLDAPALRDDYYCSLLAYSQSLQCLAVGLGAHVYLWSEPRDATQSKIPDSLAGPRGSSFVTSLSFSSTGGGSAILAIGRADGKVTLWSPSDANPRFDSVQPTAVSYVCFRPTTKRRRSTHDTNLFVETEELLVGDESGNAFLYSVEWPNQDQRDLFDWHGSMTLLARISCHTQQICGIAWSPNGELFATGGNDNKLFLFETTKILRTPQNRGALETAAVNMSPEGVATLPPGQSNVLAILPGKQKHTFSLNAACKAIAFAPWQPSLIAAGGGSNDRCIHFFHALSGARLATIDCYAQVTSLVFNPQKREIAATFGFAQPEHPYRVAVFAWPSCRMVVGIPWWGEERALYGIIYPGGSLVVATSDASIKFHEVWSGKDGGGVSGGVLGSTILDDELSMERVEGIR
ncbi:hypothetical protein Q7P37_004191 [Cladosporium fusiforme]